MPGGVYDCGQAGDSCWSACLDVGLEGEGGAFQVIGNRWPNLDDPHLCRTLYELTYSIRAAPPPWHRTRIVTFQSRYTIRNDGASRSLRVAQAGVEGKAIKLRAGSGQAFHWPDFQRDALLVVSLGGEEQQQEDEEDEQFEWSGPVDISSIADIPLVVRGKRRRSTRRVGHQSGGWELVEGSAAAKVLELTCMQGLSTVAPGHRRLLSHPVSCCPASAA